MKHFSNRERIQSVLHRQRKHCIKVNPKDHTQKLCETRRVACSVSEKDFKVPEVVLVLTWTSLDTQAALAEEAELVEVSDCEGLSNAKQCE